jgi:hypothetical protein
MEKGIPAAVIKGGLSAWRKASLPVEAVPHDEMAVLTGLRAVAAAMPAKTNAARILDAAGVVYQLKEYEIDENDLSAPPVAEKIGMPPEQVFKTLVARGDRTGVLMAAIPANTELDLKAIAAASGHKKVELVPVKEVLGLTGSHPRRRVAGRRAEALSFLPRRDRDSVRHDQRERGSSRVPDDPGTR